MVGKWLETYAVRPGSCDYSSYETLEVYWIFEKFDFLLNTEIGRAHV